MLAKQILFGAPPSHNESPQRPQKVLKANLLGQTYSFNEHPCCIVYIRFGPLPVISTYHPIYVTSNPIEITSYN